MNCDLFWPVGFAAATAQRLLFFGVGILRCAFMPLLDECNKVNPLFCNKLAFILHQIIISTLFNSFLFFFLVYFHFLVLVLYFQDVTNYFTAALRINCLCPDCELQKLSFFCLKTTLDHTVTKLWHLSQVSSSTLSQVATPPYFFSSTSKGERSNIAEGCKQRAKCVDSKNKAPGIFKHCSKTGHEQVSGQSFKIYCVDQ